MDTEDSRHTAGHEGIDEHARPGLLLALLGQFAMHRLREAHTVHRLTPRQFQLMVLLNQAGVLNQSELATAMNVAASVLVTHLNPLEADGLIARTRDPRDRRRHVITLTELGVVRLAESERAQLDAEDRLFIALGSSEREQLRALLSRVYASTERPDAC
ncbi:MarR family winged helix-turn-helix transcriptional regulator [Nocardia jinanensis]|uniref:MarR family transcriptional regulator n=1 Tax=Nocardia jinanensis TaxID=382504 RepID=A0A917RXF0_9NOCA|nr:MarR family winged helix-turn-helix transcriptional regulator [Nocardia jinanensis]GGL41928.1 MarR family transcriptional regulator [Nocardia jinanensis]